MITSLKRAAKVTAITVAFAASGSGIALAGTTSGNNSILGGNQISLPISIPVNICGNAVALLGGSFAFCQGGASVSHESDGGAGAVTSGNHSILGGNQVRAPISAPVNVCGNAVGLLGHALAACQGGASVGRHDRDRDRGAGAVTSGNHSILGGNQVRAPISVPVNVCGNAVAVLGGAFAACQGGASVESSGGSGSITSGNSSIGGGNQVSVPVSVPVNVCGNSVAVLGLAASHCQGGTPPPPCRCRHHRPPPPCRCRHHRPPPPCRCRHHHHHHEGPPPSHHHQGGSGSSVTSTPAAGSLPTTGANFLGLLALAGGVTVAGAGSLLLTRRGLAHGLFATARRVTRASAAAR